MKKIPQGIYSATEAQAVIQAEMNEAHDRYGEYASPIEAVGVMQEEMTEVWAEIHGNCPMMARREALQLAAVCIRFATSTTTREDKGQL